LAQLDHTLAQMKYTEAQQALQELYSAASIATVEQEIATAQAARQAGGGNRIPTPLINALIEFLKKKAGP